MERRELWLRIARSPRNARFGDVDRLLRLAGRELSRIRGSHYIYYRDGSHFSMPRHGAMVRPVYVRLVLDLTEERNNDD